MPTRTVMEVADLVAHHGGMGTTLAAAAYGVPQLLLPQGDQFANAHAVPRARIGQALIGPRADGAVSDALATLHADQDIREAARAVAQSIAETPGPDHVAKELISRAARGRLTGNDRDRDTKLA